MISVFKNSQIHTHILKNHKYMLQHPNKIYWHPGMDRVIQTFLLNREDVIQASLLLHT